MVDLPSNGITFTISGSPVYGQYADDTWVIEANGEQLTAAAPAYSTYTRTGNPAGDRHMHGMTKNPNCPGWTQAWDSDVHVSGSAGWGWNGTLGMPYTLQPGDAIIKGQSKAASMYEGANSSDVRPQLQSMAIITVVAPGALPPVTRFRPPFWRHASSLSNFPTFDLSDMDISKLPNIPRNNGQTPPPIESVINLWKHFPSVTYGDSAANINQAVSSVETSHEDVYGSNYSDNVSWAMLCLCCDYPAAQKQELATYFVQHGLDRYAEMLCHIDHPNTQFTNWNEAWAAGGGGHYHGRMPNIIFAGYLLGYQPMIDAGVAATTPSNFYTEKSQCWFVHNGHANTIGNQAYDNSFFGTAWQVGDGTIDNTAFIVNIDGVDKIPEWRFENGSHYGPDWFMWEFTDGATGTDWNVGKYRRSNTSATHDGMAMGFHFLGLDNKFPTAWLLYQDRYNATDPMYKFTDIRTHGNIQGFHNQLGDFTYRPWRKKIWDDWRGNEPPPPQGGQTTRTTALVDTETTTVDTPTYSGTYTYPTNVTLTDTETTTGSESASPVGSWYDPQWTNRRSCTLRNETHHTGGVAKVDFPILINFTSLAMRNACQHDSLGDLLITDVDGITKIPHEIKHWDAASGEAFIYVKMPSLTPSVDQVIYLYYNNSTMSPTGPSHENPEGVWKDYDGVYHLRYNELPGNARATLGNSALDANGWATGNWYPATVPWSVDITATTGGGLNLSVTEDEVTEPTYINLGAPNVSNRSAITISAMIKINSFTVHDGRVVSKSNGTAADNHAFMLSTVQEPFGSGPYFFRTRLKVGDVEAIGTTTLIDTTKALSLETDYWVSAVYDGANLEIWIDGVSSVSSLLTGQIHQGIWNTFIGANDSAGDSKELDAILSEARVAAVANNATGWQAAETAIYKNPDTYTVLSSEETFAGTGTVVMGGALNAGMSATSSTFVQENMQGTINTGAAISAPLVVSNVVEFGGTIGPGMAGTAPLITEMVLSGTLSAGASITAQVITDDLSIIPRRRRRK